MADEPEYDVNEPGGLTEYFKDKVGQSDDGEQDPPDPTPIVPPVEVDDPEDPEGEELPPAAEGDDDRLKALEQQLANAQELIGRQGNELGELRKQAEVVEDPEDDQPTYVGDEQWQKIEGIFEDQGGVGMMLRIANTEPELIDPALAYWKAQNDPNAFLYERDMLKFQQEIEAKNAPTPEADPTVTELKVERAQQQGIEEVRQEIGDDKLRAAQDHFDKAFEDSPARLQEMISADFASGDKARVADAFRTLYKLAEPHTSDEAKSLAAEQQAAKNRQAKQAAVVATGSAKESGQSDDGPLTKEKLDAMPEGPEREKALSREMARRLVQNETSVQKELARNQSDS